jgi:glycine cleavage system H lipoate-binding protein
VTPEDLKYTEEHEWVASTEGAALDGQPELINSDPYGEGWIFELTVEDPDALDGLLDAEAYDAVIDKA